MNESYPVWINEGREPTPEEWANWFVMLTIGQKLEVAAAVLECGNKANACFLMDHEGRLNWHKDQIELGRWLLAEAEYRHHAFMRMVNKVDGQ
jgi:hypothetical protein